jgi:L-arabinose transport system substrate-binding protein
MTVLLDLIAGKEVAQETAVDAIEVTPETYKDVMGAAAE